MMNGAMNTLPLAAVNAMETTMPVVVEPFASAIFLTIVGALTLLSVVLSRPADRLGVPLVLLFILLGMLGGSEGLGGLGFDDYEVAVRLGTIALILILFDGGLNTAVSSVRQVIGPASVLATVGVVATAGLTALFARLLGLSWPAAVLLGAVVSSTDAAAVFAVLRGGRLQLRRRLGNTLEVESCVNDPMAVILTTVVISILSGDKVSVWSMLATVPIQLVLGAAIGVGIGLATKRLIRWVPLSTPGLYPCLSVSVAFLSFGLATLLWGSGLLAVYATGLVLGHGQVPYRSALTRVHDALAWLSQVGMFLMMGLLVFPGALVDVAWQGLLLGLLLAIVARPLSVYVCLLPFKFPAKESFYIGWVGLRGAVPIVLATFPVLAGVEGSGRVFNLVFFIVVVSSIVPGATIRHVTRWLGLMTPERPTPSAVLEMNSIHPLGGEITSYLVDESLAVCGAKLSEIEFPDGASVALVVRGRELIPARGHTRLEPGDHAYVFFRETDRTFVELLFGAPEAV